MILLGNSKIYSICSPRDDNNEDDDDDGNGPFIEAVMQMASRQRLSIGRIMCYYTKKKSFILSDRGRFRADQDCNTVHYP